jgi:hypothetical protein
LEEWASKSVYYLLLLFVLVAFFQALKLTLITEPLNQLLNQLFDYAPKLLAGGVLVLIAWVVATVLRKIIVEGLTAAKLDERLGAQAGIEEDGQISLAQTLGEVVYWLTFLLFLPAILGALELEG